MRFIKLYVTSENIVMLDKYTQKTRSDTHADTYTQNKAHLNFRHFKYKMHK